MPAFDRPEALVGAILNQRWKLLRSIGAGGLGLVYEAQDLRGDVRVAVKLLRREFCDEPEVVERFLVEAQAGARIAHPGVAKVFAGERAEDGTPYLVMELLRGQPLSERMRSGRLPVEQAAPIIHSVLVAIAAAHAVGVLHRDLKPDNVYLVRTDAGGVEVKVLDFGLSRVIDVAGGAARKTNTGMLLGTPGYMSPEQIRDVKHADLRADLWSIGAMFYELLTGASAFPADNDFARITQVLISEPVPIEEVAPQYAHWAPFFRRALAREQAERFQSATEMDEALLSVARAGTMPVPAHHFELLPDDTIPPRSSLPPPGPSPYSHDTAISAGLGLPTSVAHPPLAVELVEPRPARRQVPAALTIALAVSALLIGIFLGFMLGHG